MLTGPPPKFHGTRDILSAKPSLTRYIPCPQSDSNRHWADFKSLYLVSRMYHESSAPPPTSTNMLTACQREHGRLALVVTAT